MVKKKEIGFYAISNITQATIKDALYTVKGSSENSFKLYITDLDGNLIPLFTSSGSGGGITNLTSTDSSILITGSSVRDLKLSQSLQNLINSALQSNDPISALLNDAGYITLVDLPTFNPGDYDLEDFTNTGNDPFVKQSEINSGETNLGYIPSSTNGIVTSDTGLDAVIPLADNTNAGLITPTEKNKITTAVQSTDLGAVATSNDYNDLDNIPTTFTPSAHTHIQSDIVGLDIVLDNKLKVFHSNTSPGTIVTGVVSETILESVFIPANTFTIGSWFEYIQRVERLNKSNTASFKIYTNTISNSLVGAVKIGAYSIGANIASLEFHRRFSIQSGNLILGYGLASLISDSAVSSAILSRYYYDPTVDNYLISTVTPTLADNDCQTTELIITGKK